MKPVVLGVLIEEGRVLLGQRKRDGAMPWLWGCPGGKVEDGETDGSALVREWAEELGVDISVGPLVSSIVLSPPIVPAPFPVKHYRVYLDAPMPRPKPLVEEGIGWFTVDEIRRLNRVPSLNDATLCPIDVAIIEIEQGGLCSTREWPKLSLSTTPRSKKCSRR